MILMKSDPSASRAATNALASSGAAMVGVTSTAQPPSMLVGCPPLAVMRARCEGRQTRERASRQAKGQPPFSVRISFRHLINNQLLVVVITDVCDAVLVRLLGNRGLASRNT